MKHTKTFWETYLETVKNDEETQMDTFIVIASLAVLIFTFGYQIGQMVLG